MGEVLDERYLKGLELFNKRDFFESHEEIEELWLETPKKDPHRDFYKGVIQAAAALYQFKRGILTGAQGLYKSSRQYLLKYPSPMLGLNVKKMIDEMDRCFASFKGWDRKEVLVLDEQLIPVLEYQSEKEDA